MSDNIAILEGYTEQYMAYSSCDCYDIFILVKPNTDFDDYFEAWDSDQQEFIRMRGWLWNFEKIEEGNNHV